MAKIIFKNKYSYLWWYAIKEFDLSPTEVLLITLIDGLSKQKKWCWASKSSLAKTLNVSNQTIYNIMNRLFKKGLLEQGERLESYSTKLLKPRRKWSKLIKKLRTPKKDKIFFESEDWNIEETKSK